MLPVVADVRIVANKILLYTWLSDRVKAGGEIRPMCLFHFLNT